MKAVRRNIVLLFILCLIQVPVAAVETEDDEPESKTESAPDTKIKITKPELEHKNSETVTEKPIPEAPPAPVSKPTAQTEEKKTAKAKSQWTLGLDLALMNTFGEIHKYLDTAIGVNGYIHSDDFADVLPIALFAQTGYLNASSYTVQSMSFLYAQAGFGTVISLSADFTFFPYAAVGVHTGKYAPVSGSAGGTNFTLASFDLGAIVTYRISGEFGVTLKGGWMPVLDSYVSTNFWHLGLGATYAL